MLKKEVYTRIRFLINSLPLFMLSAASPFAVAIPNEVSIDGEHIYLNTWQDEPTLFNITNNGSLTINNAEWGFSSRVETAYAHQLKDSTLFLGNQATFNGDINSENSHIVFTDSTYNGNIRANDAAALGDVYINASVINGSIRSGKLNSGKTVTVKDSIVKGTGENLSPLSIYSGSLTVENSQLSNRDFAVVDIRNADSAILKSAVINSLSDRQGLHLLGTTGVLLQDSHYVDILNSTITSQGTAVRMRNSNDIVLDNLFISGSSLSGGAGAALEALNSNVHIYETKLQTKHDGEDNACYNHSVALNGCGAMNLEGTHAIVNQSSELISDNVGIFITGEKETILDFNNSSIYAQKAALSVIQGNSSINIYNSEQPLTDAPSVVSENGILLEALDNSNVELNLYNVYARGSIFADESSNLNITLGNYTRLEGNIVGANTLEIGRHAIWKLTDNNNIADLVMSGGSVYFPDAGEDNSFHTLTITNLSGSGRFAINTNLQKMQGDKLHITDDLYGTFYLHVTNSGLEPEDPAARLQVVQAPSDTSIFSLEGGKVDAGVWQYDLVQKGNNWYLVNSNSPAAPDTPDNPDTPDDDGTVIPQPSLTPSADAILNMASAPAYIFNNELQNLRQRRGGNHSESGVWGRYINQNARINTGMSHWRLGQNGFELGGDKAVAVREGDLFIGVMASITDNSVRDARGGNSQINSYAAGAYASWFDDSGLYVDAVVKANRFNNRLHTRMSDGEAVSGGYSQNSLGGALESGWRFTLADNYQLEPFARIAAFQATASHMRLSNGMTAQIHRPSSLQAETGLHFGKRIQLNKAVLNPYLKASVAHEFVNSAKVRLNDSWDFNAGAAGNIGRYGAGMDIGLAKNASLFTEIDYQKGRAIESPVTANLGFRIGF